MEQACIMHNWEVQVGRSWVRRAMGRQCGPVAELQSGAHDICSKVIVM